MGDKRKKWPSIKISSVLMQISFTYLLAAHHRKRSSKWGKKRKKITWVKT